jgi:arginine exporter protein ArgO
MGEMKNRRSASAARRRADLRLLRTALLSAVIVSLLPPHVIVTAVVVGLLTATIYGITWLLRDGV